jgi:hypothetical protein
MSEWIDGVHGVRREFSGGSGVVVVLQACRSRTSL